MALGFSVQTELKSEQIDAILKEFREGLSLASSDAFPPPVNERLANVREHAKSQAAKVPGAVSQQARQLLHAAERAATTPKRVMWLHRAADTLASGFGPVSACQSGCDACCHIPVKISHAEALFIGKAIGRQVLAPALHDPAPESATPCTFLMDKRCSIYAHRPAVCRTHLNLDQDNLLCQLIEGVAVPVPFVDTRLFMFTSVFIGGSGTWADLRQWFPSGHVEVPQGSSR